MFKRRAPRSYLASLGRALWPRGGWLRAIWYLGYRLRRLPDPAYKISRGIAAGVFVCFTPFFGLHFFLAAGLAWLIGGNVLAALLATFFGNPITFPIIAAMSVELGARILGMDHSLPLNETFDAFSQTSVEMWLNIRAILAGTPVSWVRMEVLMSLVFLPYLVGGVLPGLVTAMVTYMVSRPIIAAYQKTRISRLKKKFAKRRRLMAESATKRIEKEGGV